MPSIWDDDEDVAPPQVVTPPQREPEPARVELRGFDDALSWGDAWVRYARQLEVHSENLEWEIDYYRTLLRRLDPFLPRFLQDEKLRAANEPIYTAIAAQQRDTP